MTEDEWLTGHTPALLIEYARERYSERKWRLVLCAGCNRVRAFLSPDAISALDVLEQYSDGLTEANELEEAAQKIGIRSAEDEGVFFACERDWGTAKEAMLGIGGQEVVFGWPGRNESDFAALLFEWITVAHLTRDIFGNPFRPVAFDATWRTSTVVALARGMYESRDFAVMPILADALQDAGCDSDDILTHCRGDGPHVRGCWVVDLVLGKE